MFCLMCEGGRRAQVGDGMAQLGTHAGHLLEDAQHHGVGERPGRLLICLDDPFRLLGLQLC